MKKSVFQILMGMIVILILAQSTDAQIQRRRRPMMQRQMKRIEIPAAIGIHGGNDFQADEMFAGGHLYLPLGIFWKFEPGGEYYFTQSDTTKFQLDGNFIFKPSLRAGLYLGAGIASQYVKTESAQDNWNFGWNLLVGFEFSGIKPPAMYPYIQAKWTIIDKETNFSALAGLNFVLR